MNIRKWKDSPALKETRDMLETKLEDKKDIIDWSIIINGKDSEIFHYFIDNCELNFLTAVISNNLELFESKIEWILEEISKTKCSIDIEILISKIKSNKKLNNNLQLKNTTKQKVNKI